MGSAFWLLISAVLLFAAWILAHFALLARVLRSELTAGWKWGSLVPVVTPVAAWKAEHRVGVVIWGVFLVAYIVIRIVGG